MLIDEVKIRDLELDDIYNKDGFIECLQQLAPIDLSKLALEKLYYDRQHTGMRTLVADYDGFILGTATLIIEQKFIHNGGKAARIEDVCIHSNYHWQGLGKLLMDHVLELARRAKCYKAILTCSNYNLGFYRKLGFYKYESNMRINL